MIKFICDGCGKDTEAIESRLLIDSINKVLRDVFKKEDYNKKIVGSIPPTYWRMVESTFYKKVFFACSPDCIAEVEKKYPNIKKMRDGTN